MRAARAEMSLVMYSARSQISKQLKQKLFSQLSGQEMIMKKLIFAIISIITAGNLPAEIIFSGDSRVRPRMDMITNYDSKGEKQSRTIDNYIYYRARLNLKATISDGYFFNAQISHCAKSTWEKMGDGNDLITRSSDGSAQAPNAVWTQLYFGTDKGGYGWSLGRIPFVCTPLTDIHYYPTIVLDVPVIVYSNVGITGGNFWVNAGPGKLKAWFSMNENVTNSEEYFDADSTVKTKDGSTVILNYDLTLAGIKFGPMVLYDNNNTSYNNPLTFGCTLGYRFADTDFQGAFGLTTDTDNAYRGDIWRIGARKKLGPGTLNGFFDQARMDWKGSVTHYTFFWLDYGYTVTRSELGLYSIKPAWRHYISDTDGGTAYGRDKFELTLEIIFK